MFCKILLGLSVWFCSTVSVAAEFALPTDGSNMVGQVFTKEVSTATDLVSLARYHQVGLEQLVAANPGLSPFKSLSRGTRVVIPAAFVLPSGPHRGIVINLAEQRLYFFPRDRAVVFTEPVGIGRGGRWQTPLGSTTVVAKQEHPAWHPTESVRLEAARVGTPIPQVFPPGPANPLGAYVLRLGWPTYLIHGTNQPDAIGSRVSAGCVRMFPEGIEALYPLVKVGTPVTVVNQPIKFGHYQQTYVLEVHAHPHAETLQLVGKISQSLATQNDWVSWQRVNQVIEAHQGYPQVVGKQASSSH